MATKKKISTVKTVTKTVDQNSKPATITESVTSVAPAAKRCHLCPDGAHGKPLVKVINAVRQEMWACQSHAAFYGRTRDNTNRKYLPGNADLVGATAASGNSDTEEKSPKVKLKDRK
jgi:hypothetical protein